MTEFLYQVRLCANPLSKRYLTNLICFLLKFLLKVCFLLFFYWKTPTHSHVDVSSFCSMKKKILSVILTNNPYRNFLGRINYFESFKCVSFCFCFCRHVCDLKNFPIQKSMNLFFCAQLNHHSKSCTPNSKPRLDMQVDSFLNQSHKGKSNFWFHFLVQQINNLKNKNSAIWLIFTVIR